MAASGGLQETCTGVSVDDGSAQIPNQELNKATHALILPRNSSGSTSATLPCVRTAPTAMNGVAAGRGVRNAKRHRDDDFEAESLSKTPIAPGNYVRMTAGAHRGVVGCVEAKSSALSY